MKKILTLLFITTILATALIGCSKEEKIVLNVYNWGEYIDPSVLTDFEAETGIKVNYALYETNEIMYQKIKAGASDYDVIFPSDYMIERMASEGLLNKVNLENIPNYSYIEDNFKGLDYDPNEEFSVPYMWGTVGILYNDKLVDDPVDSWDILWNEKYANSILMQNSVRDAFAVALKKLGYSLNTRNMEELEAAKNLLIEQKPLVLAYVIDEVKHQMISEEASLAVIYSGEALAVEAENENLKYAIPKEGSNLWFDGIAIPTTAKHQAEAEQFINFLCKPEIAFKNSEYIGYSSPNKGAKELMSEDKLNNPAAYPPAEILERCEVFHDVKDANKIYDEMWTEIFAH